MKEWLLKKLCSERKRESKRNQNQIRAGALFGSGRIPISHSLLITSNIERASDFSFLDLRHGAAILYTHSVQDHTALNDKKISLNPNKYCRKRTYRS